MPITTMRQMRFLASQKPKVFAHERAKRDLTATSKAIKNSPTGSITTEEADKFVDQPNRTWASDRKKKLSTLTRAADLTSANQSLEQALDRALKLHYPNGASP